MFSGNLGHIGLVIDDLYHFDPNNSGSVGVFESILLNFYNNFRAIGLTSMQKLKFSLMLIFVAGMLSCSGMGSSGIPSAAKDSEQINSEKMDTATLGAGCFWCVEAVFQELEGVEKVTSGYAGGKVKNPTYKEVCSGLTGHAEVAQIIYDPAKISFEDLLQAFFQTHNPTTLNSQGNDHGTQYRSVIFYHSEAQKLTAERIIKELDNSKAWDQKIVTEISPLPVFYPAEDYHQNYFQDNTNQPYCQYVIGPKMEKFRKIFADKIKH